MFILTEKNRLKDEINYSIAVDNVLVGPFEKEEILVFEEDLKSYDLYDFYESRTFKTLEELSDVTIPSFPNTIKVVTENFMAIKECPTSESVEAEEGLEEKLNRISIAFSQLVNQYKGK